MLDAEWFKKPPAGPVHSRFALRFASRVERFVDMCDLGDVYGPDIGIVFRETPLLLLMPDGAFVRQERLAPDHDRAGFLRVIPDLGIEVFAPDETHADAASRINLYLSLGVPLIWVADPQSATVALHKLGRESVLLTADDALDGEEILPGYRLQLAELFR